MFYSFVPCALHRGDQDECITAPFSDAIYFSMVTLTTVSCGECSLLFYSRTQLSLVLCVLSIIRLVTEIWARQQLALDSSPVFSASLALVSRL